MYARADFLKLINIDAERYKSLARRGQLPFAEGDRDDRSSTPMQWRRFSTFEALLSILTDEFGLQFDMSRNLSLEIVSRSAQEIWAAWPHLSHSVSEIGAGRDAAHLYIAATWQDGTAGHARIFAGTLNEVAYKAGEARAFALAIVSVTRAALQLKERARQHGIVIPEEFWSETIPGPAHVEREG